MNIRYINKWLGLDLISHNSEVLNGGRPYIYIYIYIM